MLFWRKVVGKPPCLRGRRNFAVWLAQFHGVNSWKPRSLCTSMTTVVKWNDSAGEEAFHNAKNRFWAKINGLPCDLPFPDPDIYIDEIDWNPNIDPELVLDLEREPIDPD
ncbi:hypothetical protein L1049_007591 [Liquidambar formosana]|uniref:Uncharacterized protein n=1 Tax=Liquidambar formosana TaxID=63359 RepID=A0AAP0X419_LIQFO